ncbi:MAG: cell division protein FtsQ/DivIB, partial [Tabrizicola sp.]
MRSLTARRPGDTAAGRNVRRDPAPSKWAYRRQRWMLTPYFRVFLLKGLPTLAIVGGIALWFGHEPNRLALTGQLTHLREEFEARPEFRVSLARVEGASPELAEAVRAKLELPLPMSSFDIDLDAARARIEALDAVKRADLRV